MIGAIAAPHEVASYRLAVRPLKPGPAAEAFEARLLEAKALPVGQHSGMRPGVCSCRRQALRSR